MLDEWIAYCLKRHYYMLVYYESDLLSAFETHQLIYGKYFKNFIYFIIENSIFIILLYRNKIWQFFNEKSRKEKLSGNKMNRSKNAFFVLMIKKNR